MATANSGLNVSCTHLKKERPHGGRQKEWKWLPDGDERIYLDSYSSVETHGFSRSSGSQPLLYPEKPVDPEVGKLVRDKFLGSR